jgi:hypothetical protein
LRRWLFEIREPRTAPDHHAMVAPAIVGGYLVMLPMRTITGRAPRLALWLSGSPKHSR